MPPDLDPVLRKIELPQTVWWQMPPDGLQGKANVARHCSGVSGDNCCIGGGTAGASCRSWRREGKGARENRNALFHVFISDGQTSNVGSRFGGCCRAPWWDRDDFGRLLPGPGASAQTGEQLEYGGRERVQRVSVVLAGREL